MKAGHHIGALRVAALSVAALAVGAASAGCNADASEKPDVCRVGQSQAAIRAVDRKVIGEAAAYLPDLQLASQETMLHTSQRARREAAWQVVGRVLAAVPVAEEGIESPTGTPATLPAWQTWYGADDFDRIFGKLYSELDVDKKNSGAAFSRDELTEGVAWNTRMVAELGTWPDERYLDYLGQPRTGEDVNGLGGLGRIGYAPAALEHLLSNYGPIVDCQQDGAFPAYTVTEGGGTPVPRVAYEASSVSSCDWKVYGPYYVAAGTTLSASTTSDSDVDLYLGAGAAPSEGDNVCASKERGGHEVCTATGPGPVYVGIRGYDTDSDFALNVEYLEVEPENFSQCFRSEFPAASAIVKADWRRAEFGIRLATYDTSADGLRRHLGGNRDWGDGDSERDPGPDEIHTMRLPNGNVYRLAGLHIMTKELRHWTWTTLWWSDSPDTDFGEDRPDAIRALPGAWKNYKMCTVSNYRELDPLPSGGYEQDAPSLAAALATVNQGQGAASWCSNPYFEEGPGNAMTNCIGCHQHGGTDVSVTEIVSDAAAFPHNGTTKLRNNFPGDYSWTLNQGDRLANRIEATLDR